MGTLWRSALAIVVLGLIGAAGCDTKPIDQAGSLRGTSTEELRDWVREDPQRDKLIVFVHGFNSSKDAAWGQFPALLKDDEDFENFNIHRFGYPTKRCRQVSDIRNQGEHLASFLTSTLQKTQPKYRQVVLVGHSMGGLVILHALQKLERDHLPLLTDQDLKVLTFGTPYLGVENTEVLLLFCENKQADDMRVLNDTLGELAREWTQRFNQPLVSGGRNTPHVPLYAFRGTEDRFITKTSACGYPQTPCESVDGDHNSIVKPKDRTHLAYQKIKQLSTQPRVPRTVTAKIGIWVARLTGDDPSQAAQRYFARTLEYFISQEEPQMRDAVEVRELSADIAGNTLQEKDAEAKRLGLDQQAAIVVWGDVTGSIVHARVTLVKPLAIPTKTAILAPVSQQASQLPQLSTPPETVSVPPQSVKEPLQLARVVLALTFIEQQAWAKAARQLDNYIGATPSTAVRSADIYFHTGFAHLKVFETSGMPGSLAKAREMYEEAGAGYQKETDWDLYALVQNSLGVTYGVLAEIVDEPAKDLQRSLNAFTKAARVQKEQKNRSHYFGTKTNIGLVYVKLAEHGIEPANNLERSVKVLEAAADWYEEQKDWAGYAMVQFNLGTTYVVMAQRGVAPKDNLQHSVEALTKAASWYEKQQNWASYAAAQNNLGLTYQVMAQRGVAPEDNLQHSVEALTKAACRYKEQQNWASYEKVQINLGVTYQLRAARGVAPEDNLRLANQACKEASAHGQN